MPPLTVMFSPHGPLTACWVLHALCWLLDRGSPPAGYTISEHCVAALGLVCAMALPSGQPPHQPVRGVQPAPTEADLQGLDLRADLEGRQRYSTFLQP